MNKADVYRVIEEICPSELQENWDNCGLQVDAEQDEVSRILVALEMEPEVLEEARSIGAQLVVTHHPLLFRGLKQISPLHPEGGLATGLIRSGIGQYACHTSFDIMEGGNNDELGKILGMKNVRLLGDPDNLCRRGEIPEELTLREFIAYAAEQLEMEPRFFHACGDADALVRTAAWCTGGGAEFIDLAADQGCDLFITGDLKYHDAQAALYRGISVLDAGHFGTEKIFTANMAERLRDSLRGSGVEVVESKVDLNPFIC